MANPSWDHYRSEIERLYIQENKTRSEVVSLMEIEHGWKRSASEYSKKFKEWGLRKNDQPRNDQWISKKVEKRKREDGKDSEIFIDGIQIHLSKLARSKYRKGFLTEGSRHAPCPSTPEGYAVATPISSELPILWSDSLPWTRFMRLLQPSDHNDNSLSMVLSLTASQNSKNIARGMDFALMQSLGTIIPWDKLQNLRNMRSDSRISTALSILMPEKERRQRDTLSAALSTSSAGIQERLKLVFYLISNNLIWQNHDYHNLEQNDNLVLQVFTDFGLDDLQCLKILLSCGEPTAESIAEKLFAAAIRQENFDIFKKMLCVGMNPNGLIEKDRYNLRYYFNEAFLSPLQYVVIWYRGAEYEKRSELLIFHGADINFSVKNNGQNALYLAIDLKNFTAIRGLLDRGATVTQECARAAAAVCPAEIENFNLIENIMDIYFNADVPAEKDYMVTLQSAVEHDNLPIVKRSLAKGPALDRLVIFYFEGDKNAKTTFLGLAARHSRIEIVQLLIHASVRQEPSLLPGYVSPLAIAVDRGRFHICEILLSSGVDYRAADRGRYTLLERAVLTSKFALCQLVIDHGFKIDRELWETRRSTSALRIAVALDLASIVDLLLRSKARLNEVFYDVHEWNPDSVLATAIERGNKKIIIKLLSAGAIPVGMRRIGRIGNLETALILQNEGYLSEFLDCSGPNVLASAISERNNSLALFLLQNNAHQQRNPTMIIQKTPLLASVRTDNFEFCHALLESGAKVTDEVLKEAILHHLDFLPVLLARFKGSAPTAISAAVLMPSKLGLNRLAQLRKANVGLEGHPQMSGNHDWWGANNEIDPECCNLKSALEIAAWKADDCVFQYILDWASSIKLTLSPESAARALILAIFERNHDRIFRLMQLSLDVTQNLDVHEDLWPDQNGEWRVPGLDSQVYTPLQAAVKTQQVSLVRDLLVLKGADVDYLGDGELRRNSLQLAVEIGNMDMINLLLEHGANVNAHAAEDGGATALQMAAIKGYIGIARKLIDLGADVNQAPAMRNGRTALMGAAEYGHIDMLQLLLDEGARVVGEHEINFHRAVELAEDNCHYAAARLLKSFKESVKLV